MKKAVLVLTLLMTGMAHAQKISFADPAGDDDGPGTYVYPTDAIYTRGTFDLVAAQIDVRGGKSEVSATLNSVLADPWSTGNGFALQMIFIFIDKDGKAGSGHTNVPPGLNFAFAKESAWEKLIILSPQAAGRVKTEVEAKAADLQADIIIPSRTRATGRTISAQFDTAALGEGDPASWGYQVVVQSNEGFPSDTDLLTRKVNEYEGQHRFGGGTDMDCDPHVLDLLAGSATGAKEEADLQHTMLAYECADDGSAKKLAIVTMVRPKK